MKILKNNKSLITEVLKTRELKIKICSSCQKPTLVCKNSKIPKQCTYCTKTLL